MKNYAKQNGCYNCRFVFLWEEYDACCVYYCTKGAPKRPLCLSVSMNESPSTMNEKKWQNAWFDWNEWSKKREVKSYGLCDDWKNKCP